MNSPVACAGGLNELQKVRADGLGKTSGDYPQGG
jgi:hypothetical protein